MMGHNWQSIDIPNYVTTKNSAATVVKNKQSPQKGNKKALSLQVREGWRVLITFVYNKYDISCNKANVHFLGSVKSY